MVKKKKLDIISHLTSLIKPSRAIFLFLMVSVFSFSSLMSFGQTQTFTSSGTFTVPCDVTSIEVKVWGAGGAGGGSTSSGNGGEGGGAGGYTYNVFSVTPGQIIPYTVGTGGNGTTGNGGNGGDSSFLTLTAYGGKGGDKNGNATKGFGGLAIGGTTNIIGGAGGAGGSNTGGDGGNAAGAGGLGGAGRSNNNGDNGNAPGGGGGGGEATGSSKSGGNGGNGQIELTYTSSLKNYCTPSYNSNVEPITNVTFAGINNTTTNALGGSSLESFCITGSVVQGSATNAISVKGNTVGNFMEYIKVYIDWDQNGVFGNNANEKYDIGTITNSDGTDAISATGNITVPLAALTGNTKMRVVKTFISSGFYSNDPCFSGNDWGQAEDYIINVLVATPPTISSFTPSSGCVGTTPVVITGTNFTGATIVTFGGTSALSFIVDSSTQITATPAAGTTGTIKVITPSGTATSATSFAVNALPATPTGTASQTFCTSNSPTVANLSATGTSLKWYAAATGGSALASTTALVDATHYYATQTNASGCESTSRFDVTVTLNIPPTATGTSICVGGSGTLTASGTCGSVDPVTVGANNAGTAVSTGTGTSWTNPGNITTTGTPYASVGLTNSSDSKILRASNFGFSIPTNATINGIVVTINKMVNNTSGTRADVIVQLYNGSSALVGDNKAKATNWSGSFTDVVYGGTADNWNAGLTAADINNSNFGVAQSAQCSSGITRIFTVDYVQISVTYTIPGSIDWYTASSGGTYLGSGSPFNPVGVAGSGLANTNIAGTTTYYAECSLNPGCRTPASFVINPTSVGGTASSNQAICNGSSPTNITLSGQTGTIQWQSSTDNVTFANISGATASPLTSAQMGTLTATQYYRAVVSSGSCSSNSTVVTVTVNTAPSAPTGTAAQSFCSSDSPIVANLTATGTAIKWYDISSGGTALATSTALVNGTHYYATQTNGSGCESTTRFDVTATVNATPTITPNKVDETCPASNDGSITPTLSGGLTNVRYIKLTQKYVNADAWQQVTEIEAHEIFTGTNVALTSNGATATSSSNYLNNSAGYGPQKAIDGIIVSTSTTHNFWHSNSPNSNEYIKVDLQSAKNIDYLRIYNRSDCCQERGQNMLLELFDASNNLVYSKTVNLFEGIYGAHYIDVNVLDVSWLDGATTLYRTALDSGTYTLNCADAVGCSVSSPIVIGTANTEPSAPIIGTITQPDCTISTGSVVLSGLPASGTISQTGTVINSYPITGTTMTISGLAVGIYNFSASNGICSSSATANVVINPAITNTWTTSWSNGTPNSTQKLVFTGNYPPAIDPNVDLFGCSCKVVGGAAVTIKQGRTMTISNEVTVQAGGTLTFEDQSSLVQINDAAVNTGDITYKRMTTVILNTDYTYWSSPVAGQVLQLVSPNTTSANGFYSYDATIDDWKQESPTGSMGIGMGYIILGPKTYLAPSFYQASFMGIPNNGIINTPIGAANTSNLIGNPYPSALNADKFLAENLGVIEGTIYFWTHNTTIQLASNITNGTAGTGAYAYTSDDYASYNFTGGIGTGSISIGSNISIPNGKIASGQAFFTTSVASGNAVFNNSMRVDNIGNTLNNSQFFKSKNPKNKNAITIEKSRVWLDLSNSQGAFKQTLVGYITGATNDIDPAYDGESLDGNEYIDFYSVVQDKNLTIQGRALPFDENDVVPLGFRSAIEGEFTINIYQTDGLLSNQAVYIEDKLTNTIFDLKSGNYTFTTLAGTFNDRFVLRYNNKTLATSNYDALTNKVLVSNTNKQIKVNSFAKTIDKVEVYDLLGKQIYQKEKVNGNELLILNLVSSNQTLLVKTTLQSGETVTNKIIY